MNLQALLGDFPLARFVSEHYHHLPYSATGLAAPLLPLGTFDALLRILSQDKADVLVCRRNEQWDGAAPRCERAASDLLERGYTLLVRHAERHDPRLAELAAAFARDFASAVNIHVYCTPAGEYGFGWHYDEEEVFLIQTTGRKEYSLRKNTVNPWPLEETLPVDMHFEREIMPVMRCELAAGDWLYVPAGYWHMGCSHETAISLAIGVQPHAAIEVLDFLRPQLAQSIFWRQRLPVAGAAAGLTPAELATAYEAAFQAMVKELSRTLADPQQARAFLQTMQPDPRPLAVEEEAEL
jgi:50S ribosomal protein L16 3-hydroxylase